MTEDTLERKAFANIYSITFVLDFTCTFSILGEGSREGSRFLRRAGIRGPRGYRWVREGLGAHLTLMRLKVVGGRKQERERHRL